MRLIDADVENSKLLDFIAEHDISVRHALERKDMTMLEDILFEYFESQSTAYDVDRVVERLKEAQDKECAGAVPKIRMCDAIEIVKSGMKE